MDVTNSNTALNALNEHWPPKYNSSLLTVCNHGISGDQKTVANARSLITSLNTAMFQVMTQMTDYSKTKALLWITNSQIAEGHESHLMPVSQDKKQKENIKASSWIYACNKSRKLVRSITMLKLQNTAGLLSNRDQQNNTQSFFLPKKEFPVPISGSLCYSKGWQSVNGFVP